MEETKFISIIMPVYGVEKYLDKAIQSVINQTYTKWELLIINDGSKDNSRDIAFKYTQLDSRIKLYDKENGGLSDARNFGLKFAAGDYIHFFDSDDWIEHNTYSNLNKYLYKDWDIVVFGYYTDTEDNKQQLIHSIPSKTYYTETPFQTPNLFINQLEPLINFAWNKLYKKSFLIHNQLFFKKGLSVIEDIEFQSRAFPLTSKVIFTNEILYHYMNRPRNTLSKMYNSQMIEYAFLRNKIYKEFLLSLNISSQTIEEKVNEKAFFDLSYCIFLLFNENQQLINSWRNKELKRILDNNYFEHKIKSYKPTRLVDKLKKTIFVHKNIHIITFLYIILIKKM